MAETSIQWTDHSINPLRFGKGHYCQKVSPGCANCYASRLQTRFGNPEYGGTGRPAPTEGLTLDESKLYEVLRRKKPTKYFWCDMTDLFGEWVPDEWIDKCFALMALTPQHTHQVLTKRAERMPEYFANRLRRQCCWAYQIGWLSSTLDQPCLGEEQCAAWKIGGLWPLPNVWLGVSVEDQQRADERIPHLLHTPAAVRWVSYEPALGPVDWTRIRHDGLISNALAGCWQSDVKGPQGGGGRMGSSAKLDWLVCGGESGPGARPCDLTWLRSAVRQCGAVKVPVFVKQLGARPLCRFDSDDTGAHGFDVSDYLDAGDGLCSPVLMDPKGGDPSEWPEDLRVREYPV